MRLLLNTVARLRDEGRQAGCRPRHLTRRRRFATWGHVAYNKDVPAGVPPLDELHRPTRPPAGPKPLRRGEGPVTPPTNVFPQADTLGTVIAAVEFYADEARSALEVSELLGFDPRQGANCTAAAEWLGLVERGDRRIGLTQRGGALVRSPRSERFKTSHVSRGFVPSHRFDPGLP